MAGHRLALGEELISSIDGSEGLKPTFGRHNVVRTLASIRAPKSCGIVSARGSPNGAIGGSATVTAAGAADLINRVRPIKRIRPST